MTNKKRRAARRLLKRRAERVTVIREVKAPPEVTMENGHLVVRKHHG